jgi:hypothetical protein
MVTDLIYDILSTISTGLQEMITIIVALSFFMQEMKVIFGTFIKIQDSSPHLLQKNMELLLFLESIAILVKVILLMMMSLSMLIKFSI